jgi:hypothetical protein
VVTTKIPGFPNAEHADMHFVNDSCQGYIFVTERRSESSFSEGRKLEPFFSGIGITNNTDLRPNFGSLFAFRNHFQKKISSGSRDVNSLTALRDYQHGYPERRLSYRRVLERVHCNLRETGAFMTGALAGRVRRNVRDEQDVLDIADGNPSTSTYRHIPSATGRLSGSSMARCA